MSDDLISPGHFDEGGPTTVAWTFINAVALGDFRAAWHTWTDELKITACAQWVLETEDDLRDTGLGDLTLREVAALLRDFGDDADLAVAGISKVWDLFAAAQITAFEQWVQLHRAGRLGTFSHARIVAPNQELVVVAEGDPENPKVYEKPTLVMSTLIFLVEYSDEWRIAGFPSGNT